MFQWFNEKGSTRTSHSCTGNIRRCASGRLSSGSTTRAGTSAPGASPLPRNDFGTEDEYAQNKRTRR